jgi:hypothetical protein
MNPRTEKLLKQTRELPLTEVRDLIAGLKYAEEWVFTDEGNARCGGETATRGELRCVGTSGIPARVRKVDSKWTIYVESTEVGTAPDRRSTQELAEVELELRGYVIPWRRA